MPAAASSPLAKVRFSSKDALAVAISNDPRRDAGVDLPQRRLRVLAIPDRSHSLGSGESEGNSSAMRGTQSVASRGAWAERVPHRLTHSERQVVVRARLEFGEGFISNLID